jgi:hypothetical protein
MTSSQFTALADARTAVLTQMGAPEGAEMFAWPTATAALDRTQGALYIATEPEPSPDCWDAVCTLLQLVQFDNGTGGPFACDPGEPADIMGLATWALSLGTPVA